MVDYRRVLCAFLSVVVALAALWFQFMMVGLSASAAAYEFPARHGILLVMLIGGPALAIVFLVCLFGGVRFSLLAAGWMLVFQLLLCVLVLTTLCDPVAESPLDRYPVALGVALGAAALMLSLVLVRNRAPSPVAGEGLANP